MLNLLEALRDLCRFGYQPLAEIIQLFKVMWSPMALQPWLLPQRFVGRNPPTRRPKPMGGVPKHILLRQGYGVDTLIHPHPHMRGFLRFAEEGKF